jgi:hypothetical protein
VEDEVEAGHEKHGRLLGWIRNDDAAGFCSRRAARGGRGGWAFAGGNATLLSFVDDFDRIDDMPPAPPDQVASWLARVRHDLVKRLVWPARDRRDAGGEPAPGELVPRLVDDEGRPTSAAALWAGLAREAPAGLDLGPFAAALARAGVAAAAGEIAGVLALEPAFDQLAAHALQLARSLNP